MNPEGDGGGEEKKKKSGGRKRKRVRVAKAPRSTADIRALQRGGGTGEGDDDDEKPVKLAVSKSRALYAKTTLGCWQLPNGQWFCDPRNDAAISKFGGGYVFASGLTNEQCNDLGKDCVWDQRRAVHKMPATNLLAVAFLDARGLMVEDPHGGQDSDGEGGGVDTSSSVFGLLFEGQGDDDDTVAGFDL